MKSVRIILNNDNFFSQKNTFRFVFGFFPNTNNYDISTGSLELFPQCDIFVFIYLLYIRTETFEMMHFE